MIRKEISLPGREAMHRRAAARFVQVSGRFASQIMIEHQSKVINGKSMLGLLSLGGITQGPLYLVADGADEEKAVEAILLLLEEGLAE